MRKHTDKPSDPFLDSIEPLLERRDAAIKRLCRALAHRSREDVMAIITSFLSIDELEKLAEFQDRGDN